jgi:predicted  nucleic acid-binding Zn-ribbon protein
MEETPQKIPEKFVVEDLLRIKGENESYIQELEEKIKDFEIDIKRARKGKPPRDVSKEIAGHQKAVEKRNKKINELLNELGEIRRSKFRYQELYLALKSFVEASPCDPDINYEQIKAWTHYNEIIRKYENNS